MKNRYAFLVNLIVFMSAMPMFGGGACSGGFARNVVAPAPNPAPAPAPQASRSGRSEHISQVSQSQQSNKSNGASDDEQNGDVQTDAAANAHSQESQEHRVDHDAKQTAAKLPIHFDAITEIENLDQFKAELKKLTTYYNDGNFEHSQYMLDVKQRCDQARKYLESIKLDQKSVVVFDIDGTMLADIPKLWGIRVKSAQNHPQLGCEKACCKHPQCDEQMALQPVKELWDHCDKLGCSLVIVTNTAQKALPYRLACLKKAGYSIPPKTLIIGVPDHLHEEMAKLDDEQLAKAVATLKLGARLHLIQQGSTIAMNVGDFETDHFCVCPQPHDSNSCKFSGYKLKLPNKIVQLQLPESVPAYRKSVDQFTVSKTIKLLFSKDGSQELLFVLIHQNLFLANAFPEPTLIYFSKA